MRSFFAAVAWASITSVGDTSAKVLSAATPISPNIEELKELAGDERRAVVDVGRGPRSGRLERLALGHLARGVERGDGQARGAGQGAVGAGDLGLGGHGAERDPMGVTPPSLVVIWVWPENSPTVPVTSTESPSAG